MMRLRTMAVLALLTACGDDDSPSNTSSDGGRPDAAADARVSLDASPTGPTGSDGAVLRDASPSPVDAATPDAAVAMSLRDTVCGSASTWPDPLPAMGARTAKVVKNGFSFTEGPVWVRELGVLLFSDMNMTVSSATQGPPSQMRRLTPPASFDVLQPTAGSNGLALFAPTTIIAATHDTRSLSFFDAKTGTRRNIDITYQSKHFSSPNDLAVRDDGWVYFSDPDYQRGGRPMELKTAVYRVKLDATTTTASATLIDDTLNQPNGVTLSPDQKTLYVAHAGGDVFAWDVADDGNVTNKRSFAKTSGDGMAVDCAGNLYVASGGIQVFAPSGNKLGTIAVADSTTNVAFADKTLYITAQDKLYTIDLNVPGFPY